MTRPESERNEPVENSYVFSTKLEKEALWLAVESALTNESMPDVVYIGRTHPEYQQDIRDANNILRKTAYDLARELNIGIDEQEALWMGLTPLISEDFLEGLVDPSYNPNNQLGEYKTYARFLLEEKKATDGSGIQW